MNSADNGRIKDLRCFMEATLKLRDVMDDMMLALEEESQLLRDDGEDSTLTEAKAASEHFDKMFCNLLGVNKDSHVFNGPC